MTEIIKKKWGEHDMKKNDIARQILTFASDMFSIAAGSILCTLMYHPEVSLSEDIAGIWSFVLMLIITMALFSVILKTYNEPILENSLKA